MTNTHKTPKLKESESVIIAWPEKVTYLGGHNQLINYITFDYKRNKLSQRALQVNE
jgi:hypothetical protein